MFKRDLFVFGFMFSSRSCNLSQFQKKKAIVFWLAYFEINMGKSMFLY